MNVTIQPHPNWLLEAVELAYSFVRDRPVEELVGKGAYCIPAEEVKRIRDRACRDLDLDDPLISFFFDGVPIESNPPRDLFMASHIVYTAMLELAPTVEGQIAAMLRYWNTLPRPPVIGEADAYCIGFSDTQTSSFRPFSEEVSKLPVAASFQAKVVEVTYNFETYLRSLARLLSPVTDALPALLEPWIERAQPLLSDWEHVFRRPDANSFFTERMSLNGYEGKRVVIGLRYFSAVGGYARVFGPEGYSCLIFGLAMSTEHKAPPPPEAFSELETSAMRILLNAKRVAMLQSMRKAPKSGQDLMNELDLPSGPVFRDLNNMARVGLINREVAEGKNIYSTNPVAIRRFAQRIVQVLCSEEE